MTKSNSLQKKVLSRAKPAWTAAETRSFKAFKDPFAIQETLDTFRYRVESVYCCPRQVLAERRAHCFDGALFAAAALRFQSYPPLILDLRTAPNDDDHVLAVFERRRCWGAIGKSNYVGLTWREPIYRSIRELVMSYFEMCFTLGREKTLREFSRPLNLTRFDKQNWMFENTILETVAEKLDALPHSELLTKAQIKELQLTDDRTFRAGTLGTNKKGCFPVS